MGDIGVGCPGEKGKDRIVAPKITLAPDTLPNPSRNPGGRRRPPRRRGFSTKPRRPSGPPVEPLLPSEDAPEIDTFREFALDPKVQDAIAAMGIIKPTPIQALGIGPVLEGRDMIAKAETGTGKTLVFGAPMMSKIDPDRASVLGLVLCPTRELAQQVAKVLEALGEPRGLKVVLIVGGDPAGPQVAALQAGAQVVVGTPGRVIDLYEQKFLFFPWTEYVVLDEADEMLEIGFIDDVKKILQTTPEERQTMLFSATFPDALLRLAREHTRNPAEVATASGIKTVDAIHQEFIVVEPGDRPLTLIRMLEQSEPEDVFLVFCERRTEVEQLMRRLERLPLAIKALHGGYDQAARFRVMSAFRTGEVKALIATDVASRGLDVDHVTHVVNYSVPRQLTDYTHRIGRTGRAGRDGKATTLVAHDQGHRWKVILNAAPWEIERVDPPAGRGRGRGPARRGDDDRRGRRDRGGDDRPRGGRDAGRDRDRGGRGRDRDRDRDRDERGERVVRPPRPERLDEPVRLPENRQRRQRGPDDPPPRTRRRRPERDGEEEREAPKRSEQKRSRGGRGERSSERGERARPERTSDRSRSEHGSERGSDGSSARGEKRRPRRKRSSGGQGRDQEQQAPSQEPAERAKPRKAERSSHRSGGRDESGGSGFGAGV